MARGIVSPPVGWRVQFLHDGNEAQVMCGDVVERGENGQIGIAVVGPNGGAPHRKQKWTMHKNDAHFDLHPQARQGGTWQYVPQMEYQPTPDEQAKVDEHATRLAEARARSLEAKRKREMAAA